MSKADIFIGTFIGKLVVNSFCIFIGKSVVN